ncbi:TPA: hypothetical protein SMS19_003819, partial [Proteus mirabilis]|nr:hypothetical protein [Proteus mirabilis]HEK2805507.1 hypothetical protein [Proteus mirabilis]
MMNNGVVTVELSNGQKVTLDSIKKMQGDISNKADLTLSKTQSFTSAIEATTKLTSKSADGKTSISLTTSNAGGTNIELNSASGYNGIQIPKLSGTMMLIGDYGIGGAGLSEPSLVSCFYGSSSGSPGFPSNGAGWQSTYNGNRRAMLFMNTSGILMSRFSSSNDVVDTTTPWNAIWSAK